MSNLSSRERLLAVIRYEEPDYIPLHFKPWGFKPPAPYKWTNQFEEVKGWTSMGIDTWMRIGPPDIYHPDVKVREWEEKISGERWPCMIKEYETPAGVLRQEVFKTEDWITSDWPSHDSAKIQLLDDYNVPRYRKLFVQTEEDFKKLNYLFNDFSNDDLAKFNKKAEVFARQANELNVLLVSDGPSGVDTVNWLCGHEWPILTAMDKPDLFNELMDIIHKRDKRITEMLLDTPVELIIRRGFYEGTTFWSPDLYRKFFMPRIKELVDMVHQKNKYIAYVMSSGYMPLLEIFAEIGYDVHYLLDPLDPAAGHGKNVDFNKVKSIFKNKIAIIGGLNEPITLERGTPVQIRNELYNAISMLGAGGGLALTPAEAIVASTPWKNIEILINAWKEVRNYPIDVK